MLYFLYGTDKDKAREKAQELLATLQKKKPDAQLFRLDVEHWNERELDELIFGQGLFERKLIVFCPYLFENKEAEEGVLSRLKEIASADNVFILLEEEIRKPILLDITEAAEKVQAFELKKKEKERGTFNIFSLTDAFGRRDKKKLWILYQKAVTSGAAPEEIHGILFWQLKSMIVALAAKTPNEAGLAPFVFTKAKSFLENYSKEELEHFSSTMVRLYHDSHRGIHDFSIALERFLLTI